MSIALDPIANPYIGPRAFQFGEALYGRDREARELFYLLTSERIVLLHGPSGAGKTSLVQALIIPSLQAAEFRVLPIIRVGQQLNSPSGRPLKGNRYLLSMLRSLGLDRRALPVGVAPSLSAFLEARAGAAGPDESEVLIFDQFEEIFSLDPSDRAAKETFFLQVATALHDRRRWALFIVRDEDLASIDRYSRPIPTLLKHRFPLELLSPAQAKLAIQLPAQRAGVVFEDDAAERLVEDLRRIVIQRPDGTSEVVSGPSVEPVQLQVVCLRLWERVVPRQLRSRKRSADTSIPAVILDAALSAHPQAHITQAEVEAAGDTDTALAHFYEERITQVSRNSAVAERTIREWIESRLIAEGGVRTQVLREPYASAGLGNTVIQLLVDAHLLRADQRRGVIWYELAHDRLIWPIQRSNAAWRDVNVSRAQQQAAFWEEQGRPDTLLLRGDDLRAAEDWLAAYDGELRPTEVDFMARSQQQNATERRAKLLRRLALLLGALVVVLIAISTFFSRQAATASYTVQLQQTEVTLANEAAAVDETQVVVSQTAAALASNAAQRAGAVSRVSLLTSAALRSGDATQRSLLFALEALRTATEGSAEQIVAREVIQRIMEQSGGLGLWQQSAPVTAMALSPNGRLLVTQSRDGTVWLYDLTQQGQPPLRLQGFTRIIEKLCITPDNRWLLSIAPSPTDREFVLVQTYDLQGLTMTTPQGPSANMEGWRLNFTLSANCRFKLTDNFLLHDYTAGQPDLNPGTMFEVSQPTFRRVTALAVNNDGAMFAVGYEDGTIGVVYPEQGLFGEAFQTTPTPGGNLRSLRRQAQFDQLGRLDDEPTLLHFSPDGRFLVGADVSGEARLWSLSTNASYRLNSSILSVTFSSNGEWLAVRSLGGAVRLWNLQTDLTHDGGPEAALPFAQLQSDGGRVGPILISPDGAWLVGGSDTGAVLLWNLTTRTALAATPDGEYALQLLNRPQQLLGHDAGVATLAIDSSSTMLISGGEDGMVRAWTLSLGREAWLPAPLPQPAFGSIWSASGDFANSTHPITLKPEQHPISELGISEDGRYLIAESLSGAATLWELGQGEPRALDAGFIHAVTDQSRPVVSRDGNWIIADKVELERTDTALLWSLHKVSQAQRPLVLRGASIYPGRTDYALAERVWIMLPDERLGFQPWSPEAQLTEPIVVRGYDTVVGRVFTPDSRWLVTASHYDQLRLWNVSPELMDALERANEELFLEGNDGIAYRGNDGLVTAAVVSPGEQWLTVVSRKEFADYTRFELQRWQVNDAKSQPINIWDEVNGEPISAMEISGDGRWLLVVGATSGAMRLWDLNVAEPPAAAIILATGGRATAYTFSPDGRWLATGRWIVQPDDEPGPSIRSEIRVWDLRSEVVASSHVTFTQPDNSAIRTVLYGADMNGRFCRLLTGDDSGTVAIWDLCSTQALFGRVSVADKPVVAIAYHPVRETLAAASVGRFETRIGDSSRRLSLLDLAELQELACQTAGRNLQLWEWSQVLQDEPYQSTCPHLPPPSVSDAPPWRRE